MERGGHAEWLRREVNVFLKPLMVDLLRDRPAGALDFMIFWLQTVGKRIERQRGPAAEGAPADTAHLPASSPDEEEAEAAESPRAPPAQKKRGICAEVYGEHDAAGEFVAREVPKSDEQRQLIREGLRACLLFRQVEPAALEVVVGAMELREFAEGQRVIAQGEDGHELYLVESGALRCLRAQPGEAEPAHLRDYAAGDVFGELALLYNTPRSATIVAAGPAACFALDRATFAHILKAAARDSRERFDAFLARVELLRELQDFERRKLCDCLAREVFARGECVLREGERGEKFYLVQEGGAEALKRGADGELAKVLDYGEGDYFGELALLNNDVRQATVRASSEVLVVASLSREAFKRLLGPVEDILQRNAERYAQFVKQKA